MKKLCYVVTMPLTIRAFFIPQLKYLSESGFAVTVICSPDDKLQDELGTSIKYIPIDIPRGMSIYKSIRTVKKLKKLFRQEEFDLIQYSTPNAACYASIAARIVRCGVRNYHIMGFRYLGASGIERLFLKWIEKVTCNCSTSIECVSQSNLEIGVREGLFPAEKAIVVWNGSSGGVNLERFDLKKRQQYRFEIREKFGLENKFVYGFVGRITRDKGINEMLEAFDQINDGILMIVGNLEAVETIDKELYQKSIENKRIIYTGEVRDIEKYYAAMDVLVFPSYREGFGNVVIEAAAMGTPAIVSHIPGPIDAIIEGQTALSVPAKDTQKLVQYMNDIRNLQYVKIGENAARFVSLSFDSKKLNHYILKRKEELLL